MFVFATSQVLLCVNITAWENCTFWKYYKINNISCVNLPVTSFANTVINCSAFWYMYFYISCFKTDYQHDINMEKQLDKFFPEVFGFLVIPKQIINVYWKFSCLFCYHLTLQAKWDYLLLNLALLIFISIQTNIFCWFLSNIDKIPFKTNILILKWLILQNKILVIYQIQYLLIGTMATL